MSAKMRTILKKEAGYLEAPSKNYDLLELLDSKFRSRAFILSFQLSEPQSLPRISGSYAASGPTTVDLIDDCK